MRRVFCVFLTVTLFFMGVVSDGGFGQIAAQAEAAHIVQIAAGDNHSLALFSDGSLYAWGYNAYGQLGDGTNINAHTPVLIGTGFTEIAAGGNQSLALRGTTLYAWGYNDFGQLGDGSNISRNAPTRIGTGYTAIAAGNHYSLALKGSELYTWGYNYYGQLGDGSTTNRNTPNSIGIGYTAISAGWSHSLALQGSTLYAWGDNYYGQLGDKTNTSQKVPTQIGTGYTAIAAGLSDFSLALKGSTLYAWGDSERNQLGNGTNTSCNTPMLNGTGYTAIAAGGLHSLALKGSALFAWGSNNSGQLGDGTWKSRRAPILIGSGYTMIATCGSHSLALKGSELYAWGFNDFGQLGDGTTTGRRVPTRVMFPAATTHDPLYISRFSVKNPNLSIGDKAVFTAETGKGVNQVLLYDQDDKLVSSTNSYKSKGSARIWTISPVMDTAEQFRYYAVASNASKVGDASADIIVNVSTSNLEIKDFTINSNVLDVGETVTFSVTTSKLASKVSILDAINATYASSIKPSKTTNTQKIWTIQRKLTEDDVGSYVLHAKIDSMYGVGPDSNVLEFKVTDNLPRIIYISPIGAAVRRGTDLTFEVVTNAAATCVWISNDKNEKWQQTTGSDTPAPNRQTWQVTATPRQLGSRKFFAQAWRGAFPGSKVLVRSILVVK